MATATGTAEIDFGAFPGTQEANVAVTGQTEITDTSKCEAWVMGDDTTVDHTAADHQYFPLFVALTCGTPTTATGFTIHARSTHHLQGKFALRWVWAS